MGLNTFIAIAVPAGDGLGVAADVSSLGLKTFVVGGDFNSTVTVEGGVNGNFAPLFTIDKSGNFDNIPAIVDQVRVRVSGFVSGTPIVLVGGDPSTNMFGSIVVPVGNGDGAALDVSTFGAQKTIVVGGTAFVQTLIIEISEDAAGPWSPIAAIDRVNNKFDIDAVFRFVRIRVRGFSSGTPTVGIGGGDLDNTGPLPLGRTVWVDKNQSIGFPDGSFEAPYPNITDALAGAVALAPTLADPVGILVKSGVYTEAPMVIPSFVTLNSMSKEEATFINASVATSPLITGSDDASIDGFTLRGANGVGGVGVLMDSPGNDFHAHDIVIRDSTIACKCSAGTLSLLGISAERLAGEVLTTAFEAVTGGKIIGSRLDVVGEVGNQILEGFATNGIGSEIIVKGTNSFEVTHTFHASFSGRIRVWMGVVENAFHVFHVLANSFIEAVSVVATGTTAFDLIIDDATGTFRGSGNTLRNDLLSIPVGASINSISTSVVNGESSAQVLGELHVGLPQDPSESAFGEGDSHVRGMVVKRSVSLDVGAFTDITAEMASETGSIAAAFDTGAVNNTLFVGGDFVFPCIRSTTTLAMVLGAGILVFEISDGVGGWIPIKVMSTDSVGPYDSYAQDIFGRIAIEQNRFGSVAGWGKQVIDGDSKFWIRIRITSAIITTVPVLEQLRLSTNHTEINADATVERFGTGECLRQLIWHQRLLNDVTTKASGNATIAVSSAFSLDLIDNVFANNATDGAGGIVEIPIGLDTSRSIELMFTWLPKASPGNVEFETNDLGVRIGDVLDGTLAATTQAKIVAAPAIDVLAMTSFDFDISELTPGEFLSFELFRDASGGNPDDTLAGAIHLVTVSVRGTFFR